MLRLELIRVEIVRLNGVGGVLILGSTAWPLPFLRFIMRDVEENGDVVAGATVRCGAAFGRRAFAMGYFDALEGLKTGRRAENIMAADVVGIVGAEMKL